MSKGLETKETILKSALELTSKFGLESLSIGGLAKSVGMSKSGLFSHFKSKETLQVRVMDYAAEKFTRRVIKPAIKDPRGIPRLRKMMDLWLEWSENYMVGGCPFVSAIVEYDDRPGKVRDHVLHLQSKMIGSFERAIQLSVEEGHLHAESDVQYLGYKIYSNMIGYHIYSRLLGRQEARDNFNKHFDEIVFAHRANLEDL